MLRHFRKANRQRPLFDSSASRTAAALWKCQPDELCPFVRVARFLSVLHPLPKPAP